jgi:hypothetical protein
MKPRTQQDMSSGTGASVAISSLVDLLCEQGSLQMSSGGQAGSIYPEFRRSFALYLLPATGRMIR